MGALPEEKDVELLGHSDILSWRAEMPAKIVTLTLLFKTLSFLLSTWKIREKKNQAMLKHQLNILLNLVQK